MSLTRTTIELVHVQSKLPNVQVR